MTKTTVTKLVLHALVVLLGLLPPYVYFVHVELDTPNQFRLLGASFLLFPLYAIHVAYLIPGFLRKRKYLKFGIGVFLLVTIYVTAFRTIQPLIQPTIITRMGSVDLSHIPMASFPMLVPLLLVLSIGTSLEVLSDYDNQSRRMRQSENDRLNAELSFLKAQINPHIFFNTLNSIYALAAKDAEKTQQAILLLSNLMRYVLYESNVERVALERELQYLSDYIEIQRIKTSKDKPIRIELTTKGPVEVFRIEPLLLAPFVENAFKHSHSYKNAAQIAIYVEINQQELIFSCVNTKGESHFSVDAYSGIGLENVRKRLSLLYPGQHELEIQDLPENFTVNLTLRHEMYSS